MPRPIELDREQALSAAMELFWRQGFNKTSVRDLTEATQLQPGSLYAAFSNKRTLFLKSLDYYSETLQKSANAILRNEQPPLERIRRFFDHLDEQAAHDRVSRGCLLVNTLLEMPAEEREITERAACALTYVERAFTDALEEARQGGDLPQDTDPAAVARLLMTGIFGLRVYAKMRPTPGTLEAITSTLLSGLGIEPRRGH